MTDDEVKNDTEERVDREEALRNAQEEMAKMMSSVKDMSLSNISLLSAQAWHHLGLAPMSGAGEAKLDLHSAKLAIDLLDVNIKVIEPELDEAIVKEIRQNLANLQLNYVNKSKE